jgi:hypothetical protein
MANQFFKSTVSESGTRVCIPIPFDPNDAWGVKQRHYISGTVNGYRVRGSLGSDGERYFLPIGAAWRQCNGIAVGSEVEVELWPEGPQTDNMAADVVEALESDPPSQEFFESLATFYRRNYIRWIESAKRPETRASRIKEMMELLKARQKQK